MRESVGSATHLRNRNDCEKKSPAGFWIPFFVLRSIISFRWAASPSALLCCEPPFPILIDTFTEGKCSGFPLFKANPILLLYVVSVLCRAIERTHAERFSFRFSIWISPLLSLNLCMLLMVVCLFLGHAGSSRVFSDCTSEYSFSFPWTTDTVTRRGHRCGRFMKMGKWMFYGVYITETGNEGFVILFSYYFRGSLSLFIGI